MNRRLQKLRSAQRMILDGNVAETFAISCTTDVTDLEMVNVIPGQLYVFVLTQNASGNHKFEWGAQVINGAEADLRPGDTTAQCYVGLPNDLLFAVAPGTWP